jgi:hypothetical protein
MTMATERKDEATEKSSAEKMFPNPRDVLGLMVSLQRFNQQVMWQIGEVMGDMMAMPLGRDRTDGKKPDPLSRAVSDIKDAVDGATEILQQGGRPR